MELFNILGLKPQKAYKKGDKPEVKESYKECNSNGEKIKWTRPGHKIEANLEASNKRKEKLKA